MDSCGKATSFITDNLTVHSMSTNVTEKFLQLQPILNALNHFKDLLQACAIAVGLNRELISKLTFH